MLILGPTTEAADDLARAACTNAFLGVYRMSPAQLALAISQPILAAAEQTRLEGIASEALAYTVARESTAKLEKLKPIAGLPGFPRALDRTIRDLRMAMVRPHQLNGDLAILLEAWEAALHHRALADTAAVFTTATGHYTQSRFHHAALVLIDPQPSTAAEQALINIAQTVASAVHIHTTAATPTHIAIASASSESLEAVEIARRILQTETPFDETAILCRNPARQQPILEEALTRACIPAWFATGATRPHPAGRALLALLNCAAQNLAEEPFAEYLSLGQTPAENTHRWERQILKAGVVAGRDRWHNRLAVEPIAAWILPLIDRLAALPASADWGEWLRHLNDIAEYALTHPDPVYDLLDALYPMAGIGPVTLRDVLAVLEEPLRNLRTPPSDTRHGKVFIGSVDEARGLEFHLVFLPGMTEGQFPKPVAEDPLLLNEARQAISPDLRLPGEADERELFQTAMTRATERVVLTWSHLDVLAGRDRIPSLYLLETQEANKLQDEKAETRLGWPAPADPTQAIDDNEYDLAILRPAFEGKASAGAAAWLKDVHPPVIDALRARYRRWNPKDWFDSDGLIAHDDIAALIALRANRPSQTPWSPTALQRYAVCPYHFALYGILNVHPRDTRVRVARIDPDVRGKIFHEAQRRYLSGTHIDAALDEVAAEYAEQLAPAIPQLWQAAIETMRTDLHGWVRVRHNDPGWEPVDCEKEIEDAVILDTWHIRGRIDLVERHARHGLRVTDHKTGRIPEGAPPESIGRGEILQPALYALAAEQLYNQPVAEGRLFYATLRANYCSRSVSTDAQTRARVQNLFTTIDNAIHGGFLPAAPRKDACKHCDYLPICGPWEEIRTADKPQKQLAPLNLIRSTP